MQTRSQYFARKAEQDAKQVARALAKLRSGYVGRAMTELTRPDMTALTPKDLQALHELHPGAPANVVMPALPTVAALSVDAVALKAVLKDQKNGSAPGPSGWSGDLLALLGRDDKCVRLLAVLVQDITNGLVPHDVRDHLLACKLIGIPKDDGGVRPIAMAEPLLKLALHYASSRTNNAVVNVLGTTQLGVGVPGGCERAIQRVQCLLESGPADNIALLVDFKNAFNTMRRDVFLSELFKHPTLQPLWSIAHYAYSAPTPLFVFDQGQHVATISSQMGSRQGCKLGSLLFCIGMKQVYADVLAQCPDIEGVAICDDFTLVGPAASVYRAYDWLKANVTAQTGLAINVTKTKVLYPQAAPTPVPAAIVTGAASRQLPLVRGSTKLLGSTIGLDDNGRRKFATDKIKSLAPALQKLLHPDVTCQAALLLLRSSINASPTYLFRTLPPEITDGPARVFFKMVVDTLCTKFGLPNYDQLPEHARLTITLPVTKGGLGLANLTHFLDAGYISACAAAVQDNFVHPDGRDNAHLLLRDDGSAAIPTARHLQAAIARLTAAGVDTSHTTLPRSLADLVSRFESGTPQRLQHLLMKGVQSQHLKHVQQLCAGSARWSARLRSASADGAHHWLTTLPTAKDLKMECAHMKLAVKYLLGLSPYTDTPPCCFCGEPMADDPWHPIHCTFQASHGKSSQHNQIRDKLHEACGDIGLGNARKEAGEYEATTGRRPDVIVTFDDAVHTVDVSGIDPCCNSYVQQAARHTLHAAKDRETSKKRDYALLVQLFGHRFSPFVFETHGGLGPEAVAFVDLLCEHARTRPGEDVSGPFRFHLLSAISIIIQRANAQLIHDAYKQSRTRAEATRMSGRPQVVGARRP